MNRSTTGLPFGSAALATVAVLMAVLTVPAAAEAEGWDVDQAHTEINFSVDHFFTPVTGSFRDFEIDLVYDPDDPENSSVKATIAVASIDTGNDRRDSHLRSADWFETDKHPHMTFESTSVRKVTDSEVVARGKLTIKGESREVELPIESVDGDSGEPLSAGRFVLEPNGEPGAGPIEAVERHDIAGDQRQRGGYPVVLRKAVRPAPGQRSSRFGPDEGRKRRSQTVLPGTRQCKHLGFELVEGNHRDRAFEPYGEMDPGVSRLAE